MSNLRPASIKPIRNTVKLKESITKLYDTLLIQRSEGNTKAAKFTEKIIKKLEKDLKFVGK